MKVNLVGDQHLNISRDRAAISTEVMTSWDQFNYEEEFLILDQGAEDLVMGVIWFNSFLTKNGITTQMVDIRDLGDPEKIPIDFNQHRF